MDDQTHKTGENSPKVVDRAHANAEIDENTRADSPLRGGNPAAQRVEKEGTKVDYELLTERERIDAILPDLWEWALSLDPADEFSELQLASITYTTATRTAGKWDPEGAPFPSFMRWQLERNIAKARAGETFSHPVERMLDAILEAGA